MRKIFLVVFSLAFLLPISGRAAANPVELYFFEGQGCPHCARMASYLEGLKADYPNLTVKDFEVYFNKDNQKFFGRMAAAYGSDAGSVPAIFIGDEAISGEAYEKIKNAVEKCSTEKVCVSPAEKIGAVNVNDNTNINTGQGGGNEIVGWAVIGAVAICGVLLIYFVLKRKK